MRIVLDMTVVLNNLVTMSRWQLVKTPRCYEHLSRSQLAKMRPVQMRNADCD